ncbi:hypothetical protein LIA77_00376 [Sarocladium implicatum]|nr:hypothetical protein LIA77_00376 [Sarocladium implicatum]
MFDLRKLALAEPLGCILQQSLSRTIAACEIPVSYCDRSQDDNQLPAIELRDALERESPHGLRGQCSLSTEEGVTEGLSQREQDRSMTLSPHLAGVSPWSFASASVV